MNRRGFLGAATGAVAGAATSKAVLKGTSQLVALTTEPIRPEGGEETFARGFCSECGAGCGTRVRLIGGRPVSVTANPVHPANRDGLCPRGLASLQSHLHPERLLQPMAREAKDQPLAPTAWDDALGRLAERLETLRREGRPGTLAILRHDSEGPLDTLVQRFLQAYGSPNDLLIHDVPSALRAAWWLTHGKANGLAYDFERAGVILGFGAGLLEGWGAAGYNQYAYGALRRRTDRGRLLQVESRLSVTAMKADDWYEIRPGTDGILALGLAHVLLTERLHDIEFIDNRATGFETWRDADGKEHPGFRPYVLENYHIDLVSQRTGLTTERILGLAHQLVEHAPAIAIPGRAVAARPDGVWACWAVHCLNALLGTIGREGGVVAPLPAPFASFAKPELDSIARDGLRQRPLAAAPADAAAPMHHDGVAALLESYAAPRSPIDVLIILECDPVSSTPAPARLREVLDAIPLVVVLAEQPSETTSHADVLLPTLSALERWDLTGNLPMAPFSCATLRRPLVPARGSARHPGQVLLDVAGRLGGTVASSLPWEEYPKLLRDSADGIFAARHGDLFGTETEERWLRMMERSGLWAPSYRSAAELWNGMQERGGWWDPLTYPEEWRRIVARRDGRFDLAPRIAAPAQMEPQPEQHFPLALYPFELLAVRPGRFLDMPFLRALSGPHFDGPMPAWVELHPDDATELGLADRQRVRVESAHGSVEAELRTFDHLARGLAAMPLGFGRTVGRWTTGWGANPFELIEFRQDPQTGAALEYFTPVRVVPA